MCVLKSILTGLHVFVDLIRSLHMLGLLNPDSQRYIRYNIVVQNSHAK